MNQTIPSDSDLLNGLLSCDGIIITRLYDLFLDHVKKFVKNNHGTKDDAMDLFQDALCVLYQNARKKDFVLSCTLKTYVLSIARTIWLSRLKEMKRDNLVLNTPEEDYLTDDFYAVYEYNERMFLYRKYFNRLSESCRQILTLFLEGRSVREITLIMGFRSEQHTKNRRYRCKKSLIDNIRDTFIYKELSK